VAETYDITYNGAPVGTARMEKLGLYYLFSCRCRLPDQGLYRIHVISPQTREDLGICVPMGDVFGMDKKIAAKHLGEGIPAFELVEKDWKPRDVIPELPTPQEEDAVEAPLPAQEETILMEPDETPVQPEPVEDRFVPVSEEEPFEYLDKLEDAVMEIRGDQQGIVLQE